MLSEILTFQMPSTQFSLIIDHVQTSTIPRCIQSLQTSHTRHSPSLHRRKPLENLCWELTLMCFWFLMMSSMYIGERELGTQPQLSIGVEVSRQLDMPDITNLRKKFYRLELGVLSTTQRVYYLSKRVSFSYPFNSQWKKILASLGCYSV